MNEEQLARIRTAYDLSVRQYREGIDNFVNVPDEFKNSEGFRALMQECGPLTSSSAPENKEFLNPQAGMKFLDAGCCANLANYRVDKWPSTYYGVDISPEIIKAMKSFTSHENISIGGLQVAEVASLPFDDDFFDIALLIGVLEYADLDYVGAALAEMNRVLKPKARLVVDTPNMEHPFVEVMFKLENYLERPNIPKSHLEFEKMLTPLFNIKKVDDERVMLKYFVEAR